MMERPGLFYGYIIVVFSFLILMICFGINYSFGIFFNPLLQDFGWTRAVTSVGFSISTFVSGIAGIITGRLCDRFGPRAIIMSCGISISLGCFLMSQVHQAWQLYIFYGFFVGVGFGGAMIPLASIVSRWFYLRRGLMTGIVVAGTGFGTIIMPILARFLISAFNWREAFIIFGAIAFVVTIPSAFFLKRDPAKIGQQPYGLEKAQAAGETKALEKGMTFRQTIATGRFWLVFLIYIFFGYFVQSVMVHVVPHARALGIDPGSAAIILSFVGIGSLVGRIVMGTVSDRIGVINTLSIALGILLLAFLWIQFADIIWMLYLFAFLFGFPYGAMISLQALLGVKMFGLISLGTITGVIVFAYTAGGAVGPAVTGHIFDITQSYRLAFIVCAALAAGGLVLTFLIPRAPKKGPH
jgi:MFS transporter, OFA family, oxalate/formate antiporter